MSLKFVLIFAASVLPMHVPIETDDHQQGILRTDLPFQERLQSPVNSDTLRTFLYEALGKVTHS